MDGRVRVSIPGSGDHNYFTFGARNFFLEAGDHPVCLPSG